MSGTLPTKRGTNEYTPLVGVVNKEFPLLQRGTEESSRTATFPPSHSLSPNCRRGLRKKAELAFRPLLVHEACCYGTNVLRSIVDL